VLAVEKFSSWLLLKLSPLCTEKGKKYRNTLNVKYTIVQNYFVVNFVHLILWNRIWKNNLREIMEIISTKLLLWMRKQSLMMCKYLLPVTWLVTGKTPCSLFHTLCSCNIFQLKVIFFLCQQPTNLEISGYINKCYKFQVLELESNSVELESYLTQLLNSCMILRCSFIHLSDVSWALNYISATFIGTGDKWQTKNTHSWKGWLKIDK
jgi:hypothetical protein